MMKMIIFQHVIIIIMRLDNFISSANQRQSYVWLVYE